MAFLVPALTAGGSDVLLLYLSATYKGNVTFHGEDGSCKCELNELSVSQSRGCGLSRCAARQLIFLLVSHRCHYEYVLYECLGYNTTVSVTVSTGLPFIYRNGGEMPNLLSHVLWHFPRDFARAHAGNHNA